MQIHCHVQQGWLNAAEGIFLGPFFWRDEDRSAIQCKTAGKPQKPEEEKRKKYAVNSVLTKDQNLSGAISPFHS